MTNETKHEIVVALIEEGYSVDDIPGIIASATLFKSFEDFIEATVRTYVDPNAVSAILSALDYDQFADTLGDNGLNMIELPDLQYLTWMERDEYDPN